MNKLMGFYELKAMNIPSIPWKEYTGVELFDKQHLWTVRSAVFRGDDLNLPRLVGGNSEEAKMFADKLLNKMRDKGIVVFYPYFLANKSGTLNIFNNRIIIEAVKKDLWNLVTFSDREVTIEVVDNKRVVNGNEKFLTDEEINNLLANVSHIKKTFRDDLLEGKSVLLEWSLAQQSDLDKKPIGEEFLVFYEARTIK